MLVGIYDVKDPNGKDIASTGIYERILYDSGIDTIRLNVAQDDFWSKVATLSLFVMRYQQIDSNLQLARDILPIIEKQYEVPCFPNFASNWHYDDKIKQFFLLSAHEFPITDSWVFYSRDVAQQWVVSADYPLVFKLRGGAGSMNVLLVNTINEASRLVNLMFSAGVYPESLNDKGLVRYKDGTIYKQLHHVLGNIYRRYKGLDASPYWAKHKNYVLFQRYLPGNDFDTRITVIGDRAFGFRRMVRKNDFRASGSGMIDYDAQNIDIRCIEIAFKISKKLGFQSMAYDFLRNEDNEPEICEISYTYLSEAVSNCEGYWDPSLAWHKGNFLPESLHLADALKNADLITTRKNSEAS